MGTIARERVRDELVLAKSIIRAAIAKLGKDSTLLPKDLLEQAASKSVSEGALIDAVWDLAQVGEIIVTEDWRIRAAA